MSEKFYCYSNRLSYFLMSMKFRYVSTGINPNTNKKFWVYEKGKNLDEAIILYNSIKHRFN